KKIADLLKALEQQTALDARATTQLGDAVTKIQQIKEQRAAGPRSNRNFNEDQLVTTIVDDPQTFDPSAPLWKELTDDGLNRLAARRWTASQEIRSKPVTFGAVVSSEVTHIATLALTAILIFIAVLAGCLYTYKLILRYRLLLHHKAALGLYARCQEFIELVKYQSTIGTSSEVSVTPKYFSGKVTRSKQLADRPLSLPGLTDTCSEFLQEVAEVFSGKVVICIDELDKITEIAQLFELLKGIKGILGQDNTHFILTVSEDAMTFFNERLSRERSLIES